MDGTSTLYKIHKIILDLESIATLELLQTTF